MAVDFVNRIYYFKENELPNPNLSPLPDQCPVCNYGISPEFIFIYNKNNWTSEVLCGCPRNECGALFFAVYHEDTFNGKGFLAELYPISKVKKEFPDEINELSSDFVAVYNQALNAEQEGLNLICGVGYRKALEYLIKDYVIKLQPDAINKIKSMPLQQCIQQYIDEADIKEMAERAVWLGNDETHYVRKWENKDIEDLKKLIDLTVYFIAMKLTALKYKEEMNR